MRIELVHEPSAGPRPFLLRARLAGGVIQEGFATREAAEAARPTFVSALRGAFA